MFVDDAIVNIEGAGQAGLKGLYLRPGISLPDLEWRGYFTSSKSI